MNRRATILAAAVAVAGVGGIAVAVYMPIWDTYTPRPETYEVSADGAHITVAFCGSNADTIATQAIREDDRSVIVGVRLRQNRKVFQHGTSLKVTFALQGPLLSRVVRDEGGTPVPSGSQYLCPG
jgi:hypothetical protein